MEAWRLLSIAGLVLLEFVLRLLCTMSLYEFRGGLEPALNGITGWDSEIEKRDLRAWWHLKCAGRFVCIQRYTERHQTSQSYWSLLKPFPGMLASRSDGRHQQIPAYTSEILAEYF